MLTSSLIHANRGYLVGVVSLSFFWLANNNNPCFLEKRDLNDHFCPPGEVQDSRPSPSDMAVPLGRGHLPPAQLLANGAATGWYPLPDSMPAPDLGCMCSLLAKHLKRLKGSSSSGLDMVATPFLKYVVRYVPRAEGRGFHAEHVLLPLLAQLFLLFFESARVAS